jgi:hypothetical protein
MHLRGHIFKLDKLYEAGEGLWAGKHYKSLNAMMRRVMKARATEKGLSVRKYLELIKRERDERNKLNPPARFEYGELDEVADGVWHDDEFLPVEVLQEAIDLLNASAAAKAAGSN